MNALNPALTIAGPCALIYKDKVVYTKDDVPLEIVEEEIVLESSAYGACGVAVKSTVLETSVTPLGAIDCLAEFVPAHIRRAIPGVLVHHAIDLGTINTGTGVIAKTAHGLRDTGPARVATFGVLPAALSDATLYYVHVLTADTYTLHSTKAHAAAGTSPITPATAGTGRHRLIEQEPLIIWSLTESKGYTFHNAAVTGVPSLVATSIKTIFETVKLTMYRKFGGDPEATDAFYTEITELPAGTDLTFDPDAIVMGASTAAWGTADAPWSAMSLDENGAKFAINMSLSPVTDQVGGIVSHRVDSVAATCTLRPKNVDETHVFSKRLIQGTGAKVGRRRTGATLTITTDDFTMALNNAVLSKSPVGFDGKTDRVRDLEFTAIRKFDAGVLQPLFDITIAE